MLAASNSTPAYYQRYSNVTKSSQIVKIKRLKSVSRFQVSQFSRSYPECGNNQVDHTKILFSVFSDPLLLHKSQLIFKAQLEFNFFLKSSTVYFPDTPKCPLIASNSQKFCRAPIFYQFRLSSGSFLTFLLLYRYEKNISLCSS